MTTVNPNEESAGPISITLKAGSGYEAPWIVLRGNTADEVLNRLAEISEATVPQVVATVAADFITAWQAEKSTRASGGSTAVNNVVKAVGGTVVESYGQPVVTTAPAAPSGGPTCAHGERVFREGSSAKGPWAAYFCPTPKGTEGQCKPLFRGKDGTFA